MSLGGLTTVSSIVKASFFLATLISCALGQGQDDTCACNVFGEPHYRSFDKRRFSFQGRCKYVLAEAAQPSTCYFVVGAQNSPPILSQPGGPTSTQWVDIFIFGNRFTFNQNNTLHVNGEKTTSVFNGDQVSTIRTGNWIVFDSRQCGIQLLWDGDMAVQIRLTKATWGGRVRGLCGNCNDDPNDDFTTRDGTVVTDEWQFGSSWQLNDNTVQQQDPSICPSTPTPNPPPQPSPLEIQNLCQGQWEQIVQQPDHCGFFRPETPNNPFAQCVANSNLNFLFLYSACRFDVCVNGQNPVAIRRQVCDALTSLAEQCAIRGMQNVHWRQAANCQQVCGENQDYSFTVAPCPMSCAFARNGRTPEACRNFLPSSEGCQCREGFIRHGRRCVTQDQCPLEQKVTLRPIPTDPGMPGMTMITTTTTTTTITQNGGNPMPPQPMITDQQTTFLSHTGRKPDLGRPNNGQCACRCKRR